ncbi:MAG: PduL/EutD family phosphate acyltransferase [Clostridiales bacterium]|nr:PduL/EutD family phosphate acyltransferase [Clostridiales bacterium]
MSDRIYQLTEDLVCETFAKKGQFFVPVASSNRHVHLCRADVDALFGAGHALTKMRDLKQPGQFACQEQVTLKAEHGSLTLRVVGPVRPETQVELSVSDLTKLHLPICVRMSGSIAGSPGATLATERGSVCLKQGIIVSARHLHLSLAQAKSYGLDNNDNVRLFVEGDRPTVFENVIVRCGDGHTLEAHIDVDEANGAHLRPHAICRIEKQRNETYLRREQAPALQADGSRLHGNITPAREAPIYALSGLVTEKTKRADLPGLPKKNLLTEGDVLAAAGRGEMFMTLEKGTVVTPLALDRAKRLGIKLD